MSRTALVHKVEATRIEAVPDRARRLATKPLELRSNSEGTPPAFPLARKLACPP